MDGVFLFFPFFFYKPKFKAATPFFFFASTLFFLKEAESSISYVVPGRKPNQRSSKGEASAPSFLWPSGDGNKATPPPLPPASFAFEAFSSSPALFLPLSSFSASFSSCLNSGERAASTGHSRASFHRDTVLYLVSPSLVARAKRAATAA